MWGNGPAAPGGARAGGHSAAVGTDPQSPGVSPAWAGQGWDQLEAFSHPKPFHDFTCGSVMGR